MDDMPPNGPSTEKELADRLIFRCEHGEARLVDGHVWVRYRESGAMLEAMGQEITRLQRESLSNCAKYNRLRVLGPAKPKPTREALVEVIAAAWYKSQEGDVVTIAKSWGAIADAVLEVL